MEKQRYTNPADANALLCYQSIQRQDPGNSEAAQAFDQMTAFYLESGRRAIHNGDYERKIDRIERLRKIDPNSLAVTQLYLGIEEDVPEAWLSCARKAIDEGEKKMRADGIESNFWGAAGEKLTATDKCGYLTPPKRIREKVMDLINEDCYRSPTAIDFAMVYRQFYLYHPDYFKYVVMAECRKVYNRPDSQAKREAEMSR